mmetsp:Transcript_7091/g.8176  ORF Transcript_7091/g.8176 Transcript_7091/m.8176 type:complete len:357 (-) Transcript_7091:251-1321(-)|eukprot:CAMPEP_0197846954 /NCGR_PEP_ID=MMETSP1438-20131217/4735_1 /TAXON_ID=1461541 /ORGANISM="Pterosperma sp., Strain CCMP1384" /LENGTH=356 /DNA_ID=CAMNT_0043458745 /DNA_START=204 /DNA_END=1274 /DNA_ORIENTATION=+
MYNHGRILVNRCLSKNAARPALEKLNGSFACSSFSSSSSNVHTLVMAEHDSVAVKAESLRAITAAKELGGSITVLLTGDDVKSVSDSVSKLAGVDKVMLAEDAALANNLPEPLADLLVSLQQQHNFSHIVMGSNTFGKNLLPRAAALLDAPVMNDVTGIKDATTFTKPIYAGNAVSTFQFTGEGPHMLSVRSTSFEPAEEEGGTAAVEQVEGLDFSSTPSSKFVELQLTKSERPELGAASVIVSGGRGLKNAENFVMLEKLADKFGGAVGASRAAVDAGYVPNDLQIGQTGKVVAPDLYIAVGISGAIQHLAGMKDSKTIVAINKDKEAPIFQVADYGLVDDLFEAVPQLNDKVSS